MTKDSVPPTDRSYPAVSPTQTESLEATPQVAPLAETEAAPQADAQAPLFHRYVELFESRVTQVACLVAVALILAPGIGGAVGIPGWALGVTLLGGTLSIAVLTHEPPPERMIATRTTAAYAGNSSRTHERILRRKEFFPVLTEGIELAQSQGSLQTFVVAGLKPNETTTALNEIYELRLECLLANQFRDKATPIGRLGGCSYGVSLNGLSEEETQSLVEDLRRELADMFSGRAKPYVGTTEVATDDNAKSCYERALQNRRTLTTNPIMRLVYWATKS